MKQKFIDYYMDIAERTAKLSSAVRLNVGAVIVKDDKVISMGYNGTPSGWNNVCEDLLEVHEDGGRVLKTKPEVLHAETNAIAKLAKSTESGDCATLFVTHAPCMDCAKLIYQSGINSVFYRNTYRDDAGIKFLEKAGVNITQV